MYARLFIVVNRSKSTPVVMESMCGPPVKMVSWFFPLMKNMKPSNSFLLHGLKIDASWPVGKCQVRPCGVRKDVKMSQNITEEMIIFPVKLAKSEISRNSAEGVDMGTI